MPENQGTEQGPSHHHHSRHRLKSDFQKEHERERIHFERLLTTRVFLFAGVLLLMAATIYLARNTTGNWRVLWLSVAIVLASAVFLVWFIRSGYYRNIYMWQMIITFIAAAILASGVCFVMAGFSVPGYRLLPEFLVVFLSLWSLGFMAQGKLTRFQPAIFLSLILLFISFLVYLGLWVFRYFTSLFVVVQDVPFPLFLEGAVTGLFLTIVLFLDRRILKRARISLPARWFSRRSYLDQLTGLGIFMLYAWGFWLWNELSTYLFRTGSVALIALAAYSYGFAILLIRRLSGRRSVMLEGMLVIALTSTLVYPFIIFRSVGLVLNDYLLSGQTSLLRPLWLHVIAGILLIIMLIRIYSCVRRHFGSKQIVIHALQAYNALFFLFLILMTYNHLTLLFSTETQNLSTVMAEHLIYNMGLPWSLLAAGWAMVMLGYSVIRKHRFLRLLSILVLAAVILKIVILDTSALKPVYQAVILVLAGLFLIGFSVFYQRWIKSSRSHRRSRRRHTH